MDVVTMEIEFKPGTIAEGISAVEKMSDLPLKGSAWKVEFGVVNRVFFFFRIDAPADTPTIRTMTLKVLDEAGAIVNRSDLRSWTLAAGSVQPLDDAKAIVLATGLREKIPNMDAVLVPDSGDLSSCYGLKKNESLDAALHWSAQQRDQGSSNLLQLLVPL